MQAIHKNVDLSSLVFDYRQHPGINKPEGDFWLFAYGSLMWKPEFEYLRSEQARLFGYQRRLCLWSVEYRGTVDHPGLVMGLDTGGSCSGRAFLIGESNANEIIDKLNQREMITGAYEAKLKTLHLNTGERVQAICLIARQNHPQYVPRLDLKSTAQIVKNAKGKYGRNQEYVVNTLKHLKEMNIKDASLQVIVDTMSQQ